MPSWSKAVLATALAMAAAVAVGAGRDDASQAALLRHADGGDGDSWKDTQGREYRLGLVNTPEVDECFGPEATEERRRLTGDGFEAAVYASDRYGRGLSVVTLADGRNLNVHLAREGFADDRYLEQFRDEHSQLAAQLDSAFTEARRARRGLWGACPRR